tara:strand:- start:704 stop:1057 length:354 start_codon:yes stop_codon:yes gene_type:complete
MNRLSNIMSVNSKIILDSRAIANAISFHNIASNKITSNKMVYGDEVNNQEIKEFRQKQLLDRFYRNKIPTPLFNNPLEFKIAYIDFKQKQMMVRSERNKNDIFLNDMSCQEDDLTAV